MSLHKQVLPLPLRGDFVCDPGWIIQSGRHAISELSSLGIITAQVSGVEFGHRPQS